MKIVLNYEEIKSALVKAIEEKTSHIHSINQDNCSFTITDVENTVVDINDIEFEAEID